MAPDAMSSAPSRPSSSAGPSGAAGASIDGVVIRLLSLSQQYRAAIIAWLGHCGGGWDPFCRGRALNRWVPAFAGKTQHAASPSFAAALPYQHRVAARVAETNA